MTRIQDVDGTEVWIPDEEYTWGIELAARAEDGLDVPDWAEGEWRRLSREEQDLITARLAERTRRLTRQARYVD